MEDGRCARCLEVCFKLQIEMWATLMGVDLAHAEGYMRIIIDTNSKFVEALLKNKRLSPNTNNIITRKTSGAIVKRLGSAYGSNL